MVLVQVYFVHRKDETKARKKVETEKLGHRGRTGKESDPIGHVSRSVLFARGSVRLFPEGSIAIHRHHRGTSGGDENAKEQKQ